MILPHIIAALLRAFGPSVDEANEAAAAEVEPYLECEAPLWEQPYDCPERVRWALAAISDRECPGNYCAHRHWVGRHRGDSGLESDLWRRGHRRGWEHPDWRKSALRWWCPAHATPGGMSTVGPHGLIYLFNIHRLDAAGNCVPWWVLASPAVSARAATHRYLELCSGDTPSGWCPSPKAAYRSWHRRCRRRDLPKNECGEVRRG